MLLYVTRSVCLLRLLMGASITQTVFMNKLLFLEKNCQLPTIYQHFQGICSFASGFLKLGNFLSYSSDILLNTLQLCPENTRHILRFKEKLLILRDFLQISTSDVDCDISFTKQVRVRTGVAQHFCTSKIF